ncbi:hypothetical protein F511_25365 [Dorcoceras hygrometricum]|uniref:Uncharacterized protein n=1 Tax=Dorcoceras hygrometricum TaxID=472368 RepID=A0A2Z7A2W3_9LAMI|nr:hypothetical protein F511_25365 [Dorcoceras hygrometricum]
MTEKAFSWSLGWKLALSCKTFESIFQNQKISEEFIPPPSELPRSLFDPNNVARALEDMPEEDEEADEEGEEEDDADTDANSPSFPKP